jgi:hypothetical protein
VIDKSKRGDGASSREDFSYDMERNVYTCPAGKMLTTTGRLVKWWGDAALWGAHP